MFSASINKDSSLHLFFATFSNHSFLMKLVVYIFFILFSVQSYGQFKLDSLWSVWEDAAQPDSTRLGAINTFVRRGYLFTKPDSAYQLAKIQFAYAEKVKSIKFMAAACNSQGISFHIQGDYYNAINYYNKGLKIAENGGDKKLEANALNNIGIIYKEKADYEKALYYFKKSFRIKKKIKDERGISNSLGNIGGIYASKGEDGPALDYYNRGLRIQERLGNKQIISGFLNNIGSLFANQGKYDKALDYFERALALKIETNDKRGQSSTLNKIGNLKYKIGEFSQSLFYNTRAYNLAVEVGVMSEKSEAAKSLYIFYKNSKNYVKALEMYEVFTVARDSLNSKSDEQEIIRQEYKYEYEKQKTIDDAKNEKLIEIEKQEKAKQKILTVATGIVLFLAVLFLIFVFNRLRLTKKQKLVIEEQKKEVENAHQELEEKNQEIMDSIIYAKRIQSAILPPDKVVKEYFKDSFILYKPKDIVAGDFYWMEHKEGKVLFAAADCTGHGVPGAMVSVVCNNALNRSVREHGLTDPGEILNKAREIVIQEFEKSHEEVKDGMDIALCALEGKLLKYAGANNPLWVIREGEIIEIKANKQPIGKFDNPLPYTTHSIELQEGDTVYLFSDGYVDQFGGEKGKKFKAKSFRELLLKNQDKTMEEQKSIYDETFKTWKGNLEQIDDVCIVGVRI